MKGWSPFTTHEEGHTIKIINTKEELEKIEKDYDEQMAIQFPPEPDRFRPPPKVKK